MSIQIDENNRINTFSVKAKLREDELQQIAYTDFLCRRSYKAATFNILSIICITISVMKTGFSNVNDLVSFPMFSSVAMLIIATLLVFFDLSSVDKKEGSYNIRPRWMSILFLVYVAIAISNAINFLIFAVVNAGFNSYFSDYWPGGFLLYCLLPIIVLVVFFFFEKPAELKIVDGLIAFAIIVALYLLTFIIVESVYATGPIYTAFYSHPYFIIVLFVFAVSVILIYCLNRTRLKIEEKIRSRKSDISGSSINKSDTTKKNKIFSNERNRQILYLILNAIILVISLRTVIINFQDIPKGTWLSNPNLISLVLCVISVITIIYNIKSIRANSTGVYPERYKYLSFMRVGGSSINFFSAIFAVVLGHESFIGFFAPRWGADVGVFLVCPVLAAIIFFMEAREYDFKTSFLAMIPYPIILILTKFGIELLGQTDRLSFEVANFYGGYLVIVTMIAELCAGMIFYIINLIFIDNMRFRSKDVVVIRNEDNVVELSVCGARSSVAPTSSDYYEYGQASNCFVIRDGSYGMIIDCGCGMVFAVDKLKGCKNVDIFLSDTRFSTIMGLLAVPNPCPEAKIRIFGPFGRGRNFMNMNGFAMPPLWPVNVIVGECISATPNKDIRLNNLYSVNFTPVSEGGTHYLVQLHGAVNICYTGSLDGSEISNQSWAEGCDILIYDGENGCKEGCAMAEHSNAGHLLFANHKAFDNDEKLAAEEKEAKELASVEMSFAKQGTLYQII